MNTIKFDRVILHQPWRKLVHFSFNNEAVTKAHVSNVFGLFVVTSSSSSGSINNNTGVNTGSAGDRDTQQYWERLKILRARCGLENTGEKTDGTSEPNRTVAALQQQGVRLTDSSSSLSSNSSGGLVRFHFRPRLPFQSV